MAKIVLAMATTHGPQLHTTVEQWQLRVKADKERKHPFRGKMFSFDELVQLRSPEGLDVKSSMDSQHKYHARCHAAMKKLADKWEEVGADIAVVLGNDQNEVYETEELNPPFMVFFGEKIPNYLQTEEQRAALPPGVAEAEHGHATEEYTEYPGVPELGAHIIQTLMENEFDGRCIENLAEARAERRFTCVRSHLPAGHARQGRPECAGLSEHLLSSEPTLRQAILSFRPDCPQSHRYLAIGQEGRRVCLGRHDPLRDR
jgi:hypothetical protein